METVNGIPQGLWGYDIPGSEARPAEETPTGLIDLGYLGAALRRSRRIWLTLTVLGLIIGVGLFVIEKPSYQATAEIFLQNDPAMDPATAIQTADTMALEPRVGQAVLKEFGLPGPTLPYTVTVVDSQVLAISLDAPTSAAAVREVNAVADSFLKVRSEEVQSLAAQTINDQRKQLPQAEATVEAIDSQISQLGAEPASTAQHQKLANLQAQLAGASGALSTLLQEQSATQLTAASEVSGSKLLSTSVPVLAHSRKRIAIEYIGGALFAGLVIGLGFVVIRAVTSDKLFRRDDVAVALSAPVRTSVQSRGDGKRARRRGGSGKREADMALVADCLRSCVPASTPSPASLVVVAVDDPAFVAGAVVELVKQHAREGKHVAVADLAGGVLASLLGVGEPGVRTVNMDGARLLAVLPSPDQVAPVSRRGHGTQQVTSGNGNDTDEVALAYSAADVFLTLAVLDPAIGAYHLATWADEAVAVVTAGQSSVLRVQTAGEMIRDAGMRLSAGILLGAEKTDESFGLVRA